MGILTMHLSEVNFTNHIEFSANKAPTLISIVWKTYNYIMIAEYTTLNVSFNSYTEFTKVRTNKCNCQVTDDVKMFLSVL